MPSKELPPIRFNRTAHAYWSETIRGLSGLMVTVYLRTGADPIHGEVLGDGKNGTLLRLRLHDEDTGASEDRTIMVRSVESILVE